MVGRGIIIKAYGSKRSGKSSVLNNIFSYLQSENENVIMVIKDKTTFEALKKLRDTYDYIIID